MKNFLAKLFLIIATLILGIIILGIFTFQPGEDGFIDTLLFLPLSLFSLLFGILIFSVALYFTGKNKKNKKLEMAKKEYEESFNKKS
jgi:hypothetical protein